MANVAFRLLLTFNATSLLLIVYMVQKGKTLFNLLPSCLALSVLPDMVSYGIYLLVPIALTRLSIWLSKFLGTDEFKNGSIASIEHANNSFLPSYLGYFFVALSIGNCQALLFVYGLLFVFTFLSQALYFNPLFLLHGYEFYNLKTTTGTAIFLISKKRYKSPTGIGALTVNRINNYTFIEKD